MLSGAGTNANGADMSAANSYKSGLLGAGIWIVGSRNPDVGSRIRAFGSRNQGYWERDLDC